MEAQQFVAALIESGLTQTQISEKTGIPQPTISKVVRGAVKDVLSRNYRELQALHAEVIGVPDAQATPSEPQGGEG